jgi:hypothetical protein
MSRAIEAENLVLRRQVALFRERGMKRRRIDAATRVSVVLLSQLCDWRSGLVIVRPENSAALAQSRYRHVAILFIGPSIQQNSSVRVLELLLL